MSAIAAFRSREFRWFYVARISNNFGTNVMLPTLGWQVYAITRDPLALGLVGLWVFVPVLLSTLPSGQAADRFERRNVYRAFQLVLAAAALTLVGLSIAKVGTLLPYLCAAAIFGMGKTFSAPCAQAWMPHLLPREDLPNAVAWNSSAFQLAAIVGPAVAGLIIAVSGETAAYGVAAGCYVGSFVLATAVRTRSRGADTRSKGLTHLLGGLIYIRKSPLILGATTMDLFSGLLGGATALLPIFATEILHVGEAGFGALRSASAIGAVVAAAFIAIRPLHRHVGRWMFAAIAVFGVSIVVFGLSTSFVVSMAALGVMGAARMTGACIRQSLVQLSTPDDMRGRVSSANMVFGSAANELGDMESGFVASLVGPASAAIIGGTGVLAVGALWFWLFPSLRRVDRMDEAIAGETIAGGRGEAAFDTPAASSEPPPLAGRERERSGVSA